MKVNVDSTKVLKAIEERSASMIESLSLINSICGLIDNLEEVVICHSYRETNKCVDVLASLGCGIHHDMVIFDLASDCITMLLEEDAKGVLSIRLVSV